MSFNKVLMLRTFSYESHTKMVCRDQWIVLLTLEVGYIALNRGSSHVFSSPVHAIRNHVEKDDPIKV